MPSEELIFAHYTWPSYNEGICCDFFYKDLIIMTETWYFHNIVLLGLRKWVM